MSNHPSARRTRRTRFAAEAPGAARLLAACLAVTALAGWLCVAPAHAGAERSVLTDVLVPLDGAQAATVPIPDTPDATYELLVSGTFEFALDGRTYDAVYAVPEKRGGAATRHSFVRVTPPELSCMDSSYQVGHEYAYAAPSRASVAGQSWTVGLDIDALQRHALATRSEVLAALSGDLRVRLVQTAEVRESPAQWLAAHWGWLACACPVLLLVMVGTLLAAGQATRDTSKQLRRIERKRREARRSAEGHGELFDELLAQLEELRRSAYRIVAYIEQTRLAESGRTIPAASAEVHRLERDLERAASPAVRAECEVALAEARQALQALESLRERREAAYMRLRKIESVFESSIMRIREAALRFEGDEREDRSIEALRAEFRLVTETIDEITREFGRPEDDLDKAGKRR